MAVEKLAIRTAQALPEALPAVGRLVEEALPSAVPALVRAAERVLPRSAVARASAALLEEGAAAGAMGKADAAMTALLGNGDAAMTGIVGNTGIMGRAARLGDAGILGNSGILGKADAAENTLAAILSRRNSVQLCASELPALSVKEQAMMAKAGRLLEERLPACGLLNNPSRAGFAEVRSGGFVPEVGKALKFSPSIKEATQVGELGQTVTFRDGSYVWNFPGQYSSLTVPSGSTYGRLHMGGEYLGNTDSGLLLRTFGDGTVFSQSGLGTRIAFRHDLTPAARSALENLGFLAQDAQKLRVQGFQGYRNFFMCTDALEPMAQLSEGSRLIGAGSQALVFRQPKAPTVSRLMSFNGLTRAEDCAMRPTIDQLIQPLKTFEGRTWQMEVLPHARMGLAKPSDVTKLSREIEAQGYSFWDADVRNVGLVNGKFKVIDRDAICKL